MQKEGCKKAGVSSCSTSIQSVLIGWLKFFIPLQSPECLRKQNGYWFGSYEYILTSRQNCKYRLCQSWGLTVWHTLLTVDFCVYLVSIPLFLLVTEHWLPIGESLAHILSHVHLMEVTPLLVGWTRRLGLANKNNNQVVFLSPPDWFRNGLGVKGSQWILILVRSYHC